MYQAETPAGLCKYKDNEKGNQAPGSLSLIPDKFFRNFMAQIIIGSCVCFGDIYKYCSTCGFVIGYPVLPVYLCKISCQLGDQRLT